MCRVANIYEKIYTTLSALGHTVRKQGSYSANDTLPVTFVTYQIIDQSNNTHYDNVPTSRTSRIQVTIYSKDPTIVQGADVALKAVMLPAGFLRITGRDLPLNQSTGHDGYASDYRYYEMEE